MRSIQQIIFPSILTVFMGLLLSFLNIRYQLLPNSPITLIFPILSGIIGTYIYFGLIHRTGPNLLGKEILVVGLVTTIMWTLIWTGFTSIMWGYNTVAVIANIILVFPTYTVGIFLCNIILKQMSRKPDLHFTFPHSRHKSNNSVLSDPFQFSLINMAISNSFSDTLPCIY